MQACAAFSNALSCAVSPQAVLYRTCIGEILLFLFEQVRNNLNIFPAGWGRGIVLPVTLLLLYRESFPLCSVFLENTDVEDLVGI